MLCVCVLGGNVLAVAHYRDKDSGGGSSGECSGGSPQGGPKFLSNTWSHPMAPQFGQLRPNNQQSRITAPFISRQAA